LTTRKKTPPIVKRFAVKKSPIHGRGVFAQEAIRRHEYIDSFRGRPAKKDGMYVLWLQEEDESWVGIRGTNGLQYLNHSSRPNAEFRGSDLIALRNIRPGQEITFHYGDEWDDIE
jgi:SET domain-containing protein